MPQDDAETVHWYRLAAEQGLADAQYDVGVMYEFGRGVPQDDVQAHMWFNLAASRMNGEYREIVVRNRDRVAGRMDPTQIAEAQRLAREWDAAHPRGPHLGPGAVYRRVSTERGSLRLDSVTDLPQNDVRNCRPS